MENRVLLKLVEELNELATILMQQHNKPDKNFASDIIEEIGDVELQLERLKKYYDNKAIKKRIAWKKVKSEMKEKFNQEWDD
jgi:hypothetical protein|tara:strand:- start:85 stop:330 length:246 start_codon:yes stop_codon:yes gene_type:complete